MADSANAGSLAASLLGVARDGVRVTVESNLAPAFGIFGGGGNGGPGVLSGFGKLLGVRSGLVIRSGRGEIIARVGDPAAFQPLRAALILAGVLGGGYLIVRALRS